VTSGAAAAVLQRNATATVNVARVIATGHISLCHCLVESKSNRIRRREVLDDYRRKAQRIRFIVGLLIAD
jgi:hypothetical protein